MEVDKDLVVMVGVAVRFVNVDVDRRRSRDVVLSIREELVGIDGIDVE